MGERGARRVEWIDHTEGLPIETEDEGVLVRAHEHASGGAHEKQAEELEHEHERECEREYEHGGGGEGVEGVEDA